MTRDASKIGSLLFYGDCSAFRGQYDQDFTLFDLREEGGDLRIRNQAGLLLDYPAQSLLALVTPFDVDPATRNRLRDWLARHDLDVAIAAHRPDLRDMLEALARKMTQFAASAAGQARKLAALRIVHEQLQNSYDNLRQFIGDHAPAVPSASFVNLPDPDMVTIGGPFFSIYQPLPVDFHSLCGVSLYVARAASIGASGRIQVQLFASDQKDQQLCWDTPIEKFQPGWVNFVFEQGGLGPRSSAALRVICSDVRGAAPVFALGRRQFRADKSAIVDRQSLDRALALKAWTSIPGAPLGLARQIWPVVNLEPRPVNRLDLAFGEALEFVDLLGVNRRHGSKLITPLADELSVHPAIGTPVIAEIAAAAPPGCVEIIAQVETVNKEAAAVEYAMMLRPDGLPRNAGGADIVALSQTAEWLQLPACNMGILRISLDRPLSAPADLWLMSRLPPRTPPNFCWARFKRVTFQGVFS